MLMSKKTIIRIVIAVVIWFALMAGIILKVQYDKNERLRIEEEIANTPIPIITIPNEI
jgi:hypothetical protein